MGTTNNYNNGISTLFSFEELYEGTVVKTEKDGSCYVNIYKFFITNQDQSDVYEGTVSVNSSNIESMNSEYTITKRNAIKCNPFRYNSSIRLPNPGDKVLVLFFNGDPQKPYYIDAYLPSYSKEVIGDVIFENNNISITTKIDNKDNPKLLIKIMDTTFTIDKDTKFGDTIVKNENNTTVNNPTNDIIIEGTGKMDQTLLKNACLFYNSQREFEKLKDDYATIISVSDYYELIVDEKTNLVNAYNELNDFVSPILETIVNIDTSKLDITTMNELFLTYYKAYNALLKVILERISKTGQLGTFKVDVTDENFESAIRDLVYIVNTKSTKKFIREIVEDGIFDASEKKSLAEELVKINNEYQILSDFAPIHYDNSNKIEELHSTYNKYYDTLIEYIEPMMVAESEDTVIVKDEFFNNFMNYFKSRLELYNELYDYSINIYNNKKEQLDSYIDDNIISSNEKLDILNFLNIYENEKDSLVSLCKLYEVNMTSYNTYYGILEEQIGTYSNDLDNQVISKDEYLTNFVNFVEARNRLLETIIAISNTYIDSLIEGLTLGLTNVLYNSSFLYSDNDWRYPIGDVSTIHQVLDDPEYEKILYTNAKMTDGLLTPSFYKAKKDDYLVMSFYAKSMSGDGRIKLSIIDSSGENKCFPYSIKLTDTYTKYVVPFTINTDVSFSLSNKGYLRFENVNDIFYNMSKIKIEFGTINSDWSPAPEDKKYEEENFKSIIQEFSSAIIQTNNQIKLTVDAFYSKVTEKLEEFRRQNASIDVTLEGINMNLEDFYQKQEKIIDNLGGMPVITDSLTTYDKLTRLELDFQGMHLNVKDLVSKVTKVTEQMGGIIQAGGKLDELKGSLLDYNNDLKGMGGTLTKLESRVEAQIKYVDGIKDTINRMEYIDQTVLTMKGTLNEINNSLGYVTGSSGLDLKYDKNGNILESGFVTRTNKEFAGIIQTLNKIDLSVSKNTSVIETINKVLGDVNNYSSESNIIQNLAKLIIESNNITNNIKSLQSSIASEETLKDTGFINNFSKTHNLNKWYPAGIPKIDAEGNILFEKKSNLLTLEKYTDDWYYGVLSGGDVATDVTSKTITMRTEPFEINNSLMYKFSIFLKDYELNTDGKWKLGVRFYNKNNSLINGYLNIDKTSTSDLWFVQSGNVRTAVFESYTGYLYPYNSNINDDNLLIKGSSNNSIRFSQDVVKMALVIEYTFERGSSANAMPKLYIDNPIFYEVTKNSVLSRIEKLQEALLIIQPDSIMNIVKNHQLYKTDLLDLKKYTDSQFKINSDSIESVIQSTITADGTPINKLVNSLRSTVEGNTTAIGGIEKDLDKLRETNDYYNGLEIKGSTLFKVLGNGDISPNSLVLYASINDLLGSVDTTNFNLEWYIDGEYVEEGVSSDKRSISINKNRLNDKDSIVLSCKDEKNNLYDEVTILKLKEGKDALNIILSNEYIPLSCDSKGKVISYSNAFTYINIYQGLDEYTSDWNITLENIEDSGVTCSLKGNKLVITKITNDESTITIKATRTIDGELKTVSKDLRIIKVKKGEKGSSGSSAYSVILSNETQSLSLTSDWKVFNSQDYSTDIIVYHGTEMYDNYTVEVENNFKKNFSVNVLNDQYPKTVVFKTLENSSFLLLTGSIPIKITITDEETNEEIVITKYFSWSASTQGKAATSVNLVATANVLKSDDGGETYKPSTAQLNATFNECNFVGWYISFDGKKFVKYDSSLYKGVVTSTKSFIIEATSTLFDNASAVSVKVVTDVPGIIDICTVTRIYDRKDINQIVEKVESNYSFIEQNKDRISQSVTHNEFTQTTNNLEKDIEKLNAGKNKWGYEIYSRDENDKLNYRKEEVPELNAIVGKTPNITDTIDDNDLVLIDNAQDAMVRFYTCVYYNEKCENPDKLNTTLRYFNKGTLYVNGVKIMERRDNHTSPALTFNLSPGWNTIEITVLGGENAGFVFKDGFILSRMNQISQMNAYAINNNYSESSVLYSKIEQTAKDITLQVTELNNLNDRLSQLKLDIDSMDVKFEEKGYKNYIDNGNFVAKDEDSKVVISPGWDEYISSVKQSDGTWLSIDKIATSRSLSVKNNVDSGLENALCINVRNLVEGCVYGGLYKVDNLTVGQEYTLCMELSGKNCRKTVFVTDSSMNRLSGSTYGPIEGGNKIGNWNKVALSFTPSSTTCNVIVGITKIIDNNLEANAYIKRIGVYAGRGWRPFLNSGNEVYSGNVTINMNGVFVEHSATDVYTHIASTGLELYNSKDQKILASFGKQDDEVLAKIPNLYSENVFASNIPILLQREKQKNYVSQGHTDIYYVKANQTTGTFTGEDLTNAFASIAQCMQYIKEPTAESDGVSKLVYLNRNIEIKIMDGDYEEEVILEGFASRDDSALTLNIADGATFNNGITICGNSNIPIYITGPNPTKYEVHPRPVATSSMERAAKGIIQIFNNTGSIYIKGLCIVNPSDPNDSSQINNSRKNTFGIAAKSSNVFCECCDFCLVKYAFLVDSFAHVKTCNIRGRVVKFAYISVAGYLEAFYTRPKTEEGSAVVTLSEAGYYENRYSANTKELTVLDTLHLSIPDNDETSTIVTVTTKKEVTKTFIPSSIYSIRKHETRANCYKCSAWTGYTSYGYWTGYADFDTQVKSFLAEAISNSTVTAKLYMQRINSQHGYASGVAPIINGFKYTGNKMTRGAGTWITLNGATVNQLTAGSKIYSGSTVIADYLLYEPSKIQLQITLTKYVTETKVVYGSGGSSGGGTVTPTPNPKPTNPKVTAKVQLNVRADGNASSNYVGYLAAGDTVDVIGTASSGWYKIDTYRGGSSTSLVKHTTPGYVSNGSNYVTYTEGTSGGSTGGGGNTGGSTGLKEFPYADELISIAKTYYDNSDAEYTTSWSQGLAYRNTCTPTSVNCNATQDVTNSFWVKETGLGTVTRHYKAIDNSTFTSLVSRGLSYADGPYGSLNNFNKFRANKNMTNGTWGMVLPRTPAEQAQQFINEGWVYNTYNSDYSDLKKGDFVFWAQKDSYGNYLQPDSYMKISHVAIVYGIYNGKISVIESVDANDTKLHKWDNGFTLSAGIRIRALSGYDENNVVIIGRIQIGG